MLSIISRYAWPRYDLPNKNGFANGPPFGSRQLAFSIGLAISQLARKSSEAIPVLVDDFEHHPGEALVDFDRDARRFQETDCH